MADFDLTQTDAQVQSILNDAQDAQGAGAQTTLTTDYIMLKGTNGRYHKILKNSFTEAVRNVLAELLVNNDKGTTISQIPAIASGDFGSVTPANLASVLGVAQYHTFLQSGSFNDLIVPGTWLCTPGKMEDYPSNIESGSNAQAILEVIRLGTTGLHVLQRLTMKGTGEVYIRCNNSSTSPYTWFNWTKQ